jgi:hypothetical protein
MPLYMYGDWLPDKYEGAYEDWDWYTDEMLINPEPAEEGSPHETCTAKDVEDYEKLIASESK